MPYAVLPNLTIVKILNFQNLKLILNCIIHYLFYVTAFSATFKLLTTQLRFLATFVSICQRSHYCFYRVAKLRKLLMTCICHVTHVTRCDEM